MFLKSVKDKLNDLGYILVYDGKLLLQFEKYNDQFEYTHSVDIIRKTKRIPIIQSYQKGTDDMVGLNKIDAALFLKLIKKLKW